MRRDVVSRGQYFSYFFVVTLRELGPEDQDGLSSTDLI
jgi:hypothetical protein